MVRCGNVCRIATRVRGTSKLSETKFACVCAHARSRLLYARFCGICCWLQRTTRTNFPTARISHTSTLGHLVARTETRVQSHTHKNRPSSKLASVLQTNFKLIRIKVAYSLGHYAYDRNESQCRMSGLTEHISVSSIRYGFRHVYALSSESVIIKYKWLVILGHVLECY